LPQRREPIRTYQKHNTAPNAAMPSRPVVPPFPPGQGLVPQGRGSRSGAGRSAVDPPARAALPARPSRPTAMCRVDAASGGRGGVPQPDRTIPPSIAMHWPLT
jgi:hypothetical protein